MITVTRNGVLMEAGTKCLLVEQASPLHFWDAEAESLRRPQFSDAVTKFCQVDNDNPFNVTFIDAGRRPLPELVLLLLHGIHVVFECSVLNREQIVVRLAA